MCTPCSLGPHEQHSDIHATLRVPRERGLTMQTWLLAERRMNSTARLFGDLDHLPFNLSGVVHSKSAVNIKVSDVRLNNSLYVGSVNFVGVTEFGHGRSKNERTCSEWISQSNCFRFSCLRDRKPLSFLNRTRSRTYTAFNRQLFVRPAHLADDGFPAAFTQRHAP